MTTFNENIERLNKAKSDIRAAIEEKGVFVGDGLIDGYADKIKQIKVQGKTQNKTVEVTKNNSTTTVKSDDGYIGLEKVTINTRIPIQDKKSETYNANGTYSVSVDDGYEGLKRVDVSVNVQIPIQDEKTESITTNGTYTIGADMGYEAVKNVVVDVDLPIQESKTIEIDDNGTYSVSVDDEFEGLKKVDITVDIPFEEKTQSFSSNGTYTILPDGNNKAIKSATITVDVKGDGKVKLPNGISLQNSTWTEFDMTNYDWSLVYDFENMFRVCTDVTNITVAPIKPLICTYMFYSNYDLTEIIGLEKMDVSEVKYMIDMFNNCSKLSSLDISSWDTSKVTDMSGMFYNCSKLTSLKMGGNVSNVTTVTNMFFNIKTTGTLYYPEQYDYSKIIAELPSTWTAIPY